MKKTICLFAALLLMFSLYSPAFAEGTGTSSKDVTADFQTSGAAAVNYKVDIIWGSMEFTYHAGTVTRDWDPATHQYVESMTQAPTWNYQSGANQIKVINSSNQALTVTITAAMNSDYSAVKATVSNGSFDLESAALHATTQTNSGTATSGTAAVTLSGVLPSNSNTQNGFTSVGTITVSIDDKD